MQKKSTLKEKIQLWFLRKVIKKNSGVAGKGAVSKGNGGSVLFLYDAASNQLSEAVKKYGNKLRVEGMHISFLGFKNLRLMKEEEPEINMFYKNELKWFERPRKRILQQYGNKQYDYLITVSGTEHYPLAYLSAYCRAKIKAGNYSPLNEQILDFMLREDPETKPEAFLNKLDQYLNVIQKNQ